MTARGLGASAPPAAPDANLAEAQNASAAPLSPEDAFKDTVPVPSDLAKAAVAEAQAQREADAFTDGGDTLRDAVPQEDFSTTVPVPTDVADRAQRAAGTDGPRPERARAHHGVPLARRIARADRILVVGVGAADADVLARVVVVAAVVVFGHADRVSRRGAWDRRGESETESEIEMRGEYWVRDELTE